MINIGAIDIVLIRHITNFTHSLLWMDQFYARKFFTSHADFSSVKLKSSFPSYIAPSAMLFRQFYRLGPTISRGWAWHLVPVSKLRRPSRLSLQSNFRRILSQPSSLKHQQKSDKMLPFRDYEIFLLFLLLVMFHGSGKSKSRKFILPFKGFNSVFLASAILSTDTGNGDPLFLNVMFTKTIFEL